MPPKLKLYLWPSFRGEDSGDGGIRRVVEAQRKYLPRQQGIDLVDDPGDADVIASHIAISDDLAKRFPDKPLVAHCHGLYWSEYEWQDWAYKANRDVLKAFAIADVVTAPSEWVAQIIRRHSMRDVRVVPHGVDLREWQPPTAHRGYVIWNKTRPDPVCDPRPFIRLAQAMPNVPFVSTFGRQNQDNVTITGKVGYEEGKRLVRHAGVYLATTRETFGIGTLEAMSAGVPVVGFNYGAQTEILTHGVDSWLAEPDDIEGLVKGVRWALDNREEASAAARETARRYPWTTPIKMYKAIYSEVAERYEEREDSPRTTIIVPAFNLEAYLPDTLTSVAAQTDEDWECIVIDDASPDRCGEIADEWAAKDERFRVIHNPENLYLAGARNAGISEAKGRYILPVDADDMLTPSAVQTLADALDADRSLAVAYGGVRFYEEDGKTPSLYKDESGREYEPGLSGWPVAFEPGSQVNGANLLPYSSMYRKEAWKLTGGYRRRLKTAEDADFWTRLTSFGFRISQVTKTPTLNYRNRPGSMSRSQNGHRYEYLRWFPWARSSHPAPAMYMGPKQVSLLEPRVTVIIPVGPGHEQLSVDAVDSVIAQTYPHWEVIVVNDSGNELPPMPGFVRQIQSDLRDTGAARNLALRHARGSLFIPLDADDFFQPEALAHLVAAYDESGGGEVIIYPDFYEDPREENSFKVHSLPDWNCSLLISRGCVHSVVALTPLGVWEKVGGFKEERNWEDWDFQLRCAAAGVCSVRLAEPLFTYRKWTGSRRAYEDRAEFERRKASILEDWNDYFKGDKILAGCGCRGTSIKNVTPPAARSAGKMVPGQPDAVLVEYTGDRVGTTRYRGASGTIYPFSRGVGPRWVLQADLPTFVGRQDFQIVSDASKALSPVLTA